MTFLPCHRCVSDAATSRAPNACPRSARSAKDRACAVLPRPLEGRASPQGWLCNSAQYGKNSGRIVQWRLAHPQFSPQHRPLRLTPAVSANLQHLHNQNLLSRPQVLSGPRGLRLPSASSRGPVHREAQECVLGSVPGSPRVRWSPTRISRACWIVSTAYTWNRSASHALTTSGRSMRSPRLAWGIITPCVPVRPRILARVEEPFDLFGDRSNWLDMSDLVDGSRHGQLLAQRDVRKGT